MLASTGVSASAMPLLMRGITLVTPGKLPTGPCRGHGPQILCA
jgi:hypothetical protein